MVAFDVQDVTNTSCWGASMVRRDPILPTPGLSTKDHQPYAMAATMQTTVERLDRPSAYYLGRVRMAETLARGLFGLPQGLIYLFHPEQEAKIRS